MDTERPGYGLFTPQPTRPCWTCEHWSGYIAGSDRSAVCFLPGSEHVRAIAVSGCAFWVRATGIDELTNAQCDAFVQEYQPEYPYRRRSRASRK
ncbi:hypothetical protein [Burkholderia pseudomallei]|uniref:hypothetical protein n=1 Tax=Burkholderia pseudomallei TaxID=28450 RepID=UPI001AD60CF5|nr:hypothetical protein [Burkholderia pseudomallei]MBO7758209.1 hypothetical protein [Burkholderia pseudomallei]